MIISVQQLAVVQLPVYQNHNSDYPGDTGLLREIVDLGCGVLVVQQNYPYMRRSGSLCTQIYKE